MSTALEDPRELRDPLLLPEEQKYHEEIENVDSEGNLLVGAAALGAAFFGYRWYMQRRLKEEMARRPKDSKNLAQAVVDVYADYQNIWIRTVMPHLISGYADGLVAVHTGNIPERVVYEIALGYASRLGEHINEVSSEAVVSGFQAQLNRKVPPAKALQRVLEAFGVPPRAMNALVNVWSAEEPKITTDAIPIDHKRARGHVVIQQALNTRAEMIGENEMWSSRSQAKQVVWMYGIQTGQIPADSKREWVTADDERVCPSCGPMHGKQVKVNDRFKVPGYGKTWSPPLHPNCRCDMKLVAPPIKERTRDKQLVTKSVVSKARPGDPYDRDRSGRFAPTEQRSAKMARPAVRTKTKPEMDPMLAEALSKPVTDTDEEMLSSGRFSSSRGQLSGKFSSSTMFSSATRDKVAGKFSTTQRQLTSPQHMSSVKFQTDPFKISSYLRHLSGKRPSSDGDDIPGQLIDPLVTVMRPDQVFQNKGQKFVRTGNADSWYMMRGNNPSELARNEQGFSNHIVRHWQAWMSGPIQHKFFEDYQGNPTIDRGPLEIDITDDMWNSAVKEAVYGLPEEHTEVFNHVGAHHTETGEMVTTTVTSAEIIDEFDLREEVRKNMPVLLIVDRGFPGETEINERTGFSVQPPINWEVIRTEEHYDYFGEGIPPHIVMYANPSGRDFTDEFDQDDDYY